MSGTAPTAPSLLVILRQGPYSGAGGREGLDVALTAAAFEQPLSLLFMDDGVFQLLPGQDTREAGLKNLATTLPVLPVYDVEHIYVESHSLAQRSIDPGALVVPATPLDDAGVQALFHRHSLLLSF